MQNQDSTVTKTTGTNAGRPNEIKLPLGLRIYPSDREKLEKHFKLPIQKYFDEKVAADIALIDSENASSSQD